MNEPERPRLDPVTLIAVVGAVGGSIAYFGEDGVWAVPLGVFVLIADLIGWDVSTRRTIGAVFGVLGSGCGCGIGVFVLSMSVMPFAVGGNVAGIPGAVAGGIISVVLGICLVGGIGVGLRDAWRERDLDRNESWLQLGWWAGTAIAILLLVMALLENAARMM